MRVDQIVGKLAQQRQAELLREADIDRQLRQAGWLKPLPVSRKLVFVIVCVLPAFLLFSRMSA
jgi:hypothetical protein